MLFAVEFSLEALGIIGVLGSMLVAALVKMFALLIAAKDAQIALKLETDAKVNSLAMAVQATTNLEIAAAKYAASVGKSVPEALVPVVPKHNSPTTKEQREEAELQTLQARITAATLTLDIPARQPAAMESIEDAAVREGKPQPTKDDVIIDELSKIRMSQADEKARTLIQKIAPEPTPVEVINKEAVPVRIETKEKAEIAEAVVKALDSPNVSPKRERRMCGVLRSISNRTITITLDDGTEEPVEVSNGASVTRNGITIKLKDLQVGDKVEVDDNPATRVEAIGAK